jgi:hypothetical protein
LKPSYWKYEPKPLKEATMIALGILVLAITVIGVGRTARTVANDGFGRVPTRQF